MKRINILLWVMSILLTLSIAVYQRLTGPTKPVRGKIELSDGSTINYKLLRSEVSGRDAEVRIYTGDSSIAGGVTFKRYKSNDSWIYQEMNFKDGYLTAVLPTQLPAGKVIYKVELRKGTWRYPLTEEPVILRYKGDVPAGVLIPHILFMFAALLLSVRSGLQSVFVNNKLKLYASLTLISLVLGGLLFGPIVQKYAFGAYWTGFPFGHDLTDNKTAITVVFWLIAYLTAFLQKRSARWWVLAAVIVMLATYLIPHSVLGSELDYTKMP
ncbi:MAG: hypothetical protein BWY70_01422 [Bacteroidetes bacterium ADurb.Bin408]|nr:MAG: hypothetical protein BWY70_01422 [Bacteroidetes bacterium ADurb.Bin408]